jgi:hypothetical protein
MAARFARIAQVRNSCGKFSGQLQSAAVQQIRVSGSVIRTTRQVGIDVPAGAERKVTCSNSSNTAGWFAKRRAKFAETLTDG